MRYFLIIFLLIPYFLSGVNADTTGVIDSEKFNLGFVPVVGLKSSMLKQGFSFAPKIKYNVVTDNTVDPDYTSKNTFFKDYSLDARPPEDIKSKFDIEGFQVNMMSNIGRYTMYTDHESVFSDVQSVDCDDVIPHFSNEYTAIEEWAKIFVKDYQIKSATSTFIEPKWTTFHSLSGKDYSTNDLVEIMRKAKSDGMPTKIAGLDYNSVSRDCSKVYSGKIGTPAGSKCSANLIRSCIAPILEDNIQMEFYSEYQKIVLSRTKGCATEGSNLGLNLPKELKDIYDIFTMRGCMEKDLHSEKCACMSEYGKKTDLKNLLPTNLKDKLSVSLKSFEVMEPISDGLEAFSEGVQIQAIMDLEGIDDYEGSQYLEQCSELLVGKELPEMFKGCEDRAFTMINKSLEANKMSTGVTIKTKEQLAKYFADASESLSQNAHKVDETIYKDILNVNLGIFNKDQIDTLKKIEPSDDRIREIHKKYNALLFSSIQNMMQKAVQNPIVEINDDEQEKLTDLLWGNDVTEDSEFGNCFYAGGLSECAFKLMDKMGIKNRTTEGIKNLNATNFMKHFYMNIANEQLKSKCDQLKENLGRLCQVAQEPTIKLSSSAAVSQAFNKQEEMLGDTNPEALKRLKVQEQLVKCVDRRDWRISDTAIKNNDNYASSWGSSVIRDSLDRGNIGKKNRKTKSTHDIAAAGSLGGVLPNKAEQLSPATGSFESNKAKQDTDIEEIDKVNSFVNQDPESSNPFADLLGQSPQQVGKNLTAQQLGQLDNLATQKVDSVESSLEDKRTRLAELEKKLNSEPDTNSKEEVTKEDSKESLLEMIKGLKSEVSGLKTDLQKAKKAQEVVKKASEVSRDFPKQRTSVNKTQQQSVFSPRGGLTTRNDNTVGQERVGTKQKISQSAVSSSISVPVEKGSGNSSANHTVRASDSNSRMKSSLRSGMGVQGTGQYLTLTIGQAQEYLESTPEKKQELYKILKEKGEVRIQKSEGVFEVILPIIKNGVVVGTIKKEVIEKEKKKEKKKVVKENSEEEKSSSQSAYYEYLKSLFK